MIDTAVVDIVAKLVLYVFFGTCALIYGLWLFMLLYMMVWMPLAALLTWIARAFGNVARGLLDGE
ncbi:MAG: hypothetical protein PVJ64_12900 [Gemmatimonadales bacterium]|jgi:hypothetical protein